MTKRKLITLIIMVIIAASGLAWYLVRSNHAKTNLPQNTSAENGKVVTKEGVMTCLEFRDKNGPHILSCAIGMKQDDGTSFGLRSEDSTLTGSIPTGQRVRITGTFTQQSSEYDSIGVIAVSSIEKL